jgi:hypothetical protein
MVKSQRLISLVSNSFYSVCPRKVIAIASAALDGFKNEARKMVVALVDMERAFVPPQHFIRLVQKRLADLFFVETLLVFSML